MKTENPLNETILRSHQSTGGTPQPQEQAKNPGGHTSQEAPVNESHHNLMQSWHNLRGMDHELAEQHADMAGGEAPEEKEQAGN